MEEAQALCSRIGIIAQGQLQCIGTPLHLRSKFTRTFRLKVNIAAGATERANAFIMETVLADASAAGAVVPVRTFGAMTTYEVPKEHIQTSTVFEVMREGAQQAGITEWSLSQVGSFGTVTLQWHLRV